MPIRLMVEEYSGTNLWHHETIVSKCCGVATTNTFSIYEMFTNLTKNVFQKNATPINLFEEGNLLGLYILPYGRREDFPPCRLSATSNPIGRIPRWMTTGSIARRAFATPKDQKKAWAFIHRLPEYQQWIKDTDNNDRLVVTREHAIQLRTKFPVFRGQPVVATIHRIVHACNKTVRSPKATRTTRQSSITSTPTYGRNIASGMYGCNTPRRSHTQASHCQPVQW